MKPFSIKKMRVKTTQDFLGLQNIWESLEFGEDMTAFQSFVWNKSLFEEWKHNYYNRLFSKIYIYYVEFDKSEYIIAPLLIQKVSFKYKDFGRKSGIYFLGGVMVCPII